MHEQVFDPEFRKDFPNVQRWYNTLVHFPNFSAVFTNKDLCKERIKRKLPAGPIVLACTADAAKPASSQSVTC